MAVAFNFLLVFGRVNFNCTIARGVLMDRLWQNPSLRFKGDSLSGGGGGGTTGLLASDLGGAAKLRSSQGVSCSPIVIVESPRTLDVSTGERLFGLEVRSLRGNSSSGFGEEMVRVYVQERSGEERLQNSQLDLE